MAPYSPLENSIDANPANLPHLLRLLDDPSELVRGAVFRGLQAFGPTLPEALGEHVAQLDRVSRARLLTMLSELESAELRRRWQTWPEPGAPLFQLEDALGYIADFQDRPASVIHGERLPETSGLLDDLAARFMSTPQPHDALALARFLFQAEGLRGAADDYYDPRNSNLRQVILRKRGIPITLCAVYMLVGARLGLAVSGCNWPGHFLARVQCEGEMRLIDCYGGGVAIEVDQFLSMQGPSRPAARRVLEEDAGIVVMVGRVVNNLVRAYQEAGHFANSHLMLELLRQTEAILQRKDS